MLSLREEQRRLQRAIVAHRAPGTAAPPGRVVVYRHAFRARLASALQSNYPKVAQLLGRDAFRELALCYGAAHPSRHFSIRWHGHELGAFLPPGALADLARMEWALGEAFDAPDAQALRPEDAAGIGAEAFGAARLALHPSVRVLALDWSVESAWRALRDGEAVDEARIESHSHALLAWRRELDAHWRSASRAEADALLRLHAVGSLDAACEGMDEWRATQLGEWFAGWLAHGLLVMSERP